MPSGTSHLKQLRKQLSDADIEKLDKKQRQDLEKIEDGQEISAEMANRLQPQLGNQALSTLLSNKSGAEGGAVGAVGQVEVEEEDQIEEGVEAEEIERGTELEGPQYGGGGGTPGDGGGGDGGDPWDLGYLLGGDDDDDDPTQRGRGRGRLRASPIRGDLHSEGDWYGEEVEDAVDEGHHDAVGDAMGDTPPRPLADREGDAVYCAVEGVLGNQAAIARTAFHPEALVEVAGAVDPIGRPVCVGRFLAHGADSLRARSVARVLANAVSVLLPEATGHAGAVARLASLAVCAEAHEGGGAHTDRAVSLALVREAWPDAVQAAREAMRSGRLYAPEILALALGGAAHTGTAGRRLPEPSALGGRALDAVIPIGFIPEVPLVDLRPTPFTDSPDDDAIASIDALMVRLTSGEDPRQASDDPPVASEAVLPVLDAANHLVNAIGRAQVEFAAAAIAVCRVRPGAPVSSVLVHSDRALRELARTVFRTGKTVERLAGTPVSVANERLEPLVTSLRSATEALQGLRAWAFATLAGAMDS